MHEHEQPQSPELDQADALLGRFAAIDSELARQRVETLLLALALAALAATVTVYLVREATRE